MMFIKNEYNIGQIVFLITDKDQQKHFVLAIIIYITGELMYRLVCAAEQSDHYGFEISSEKDHACV